jgi:uncharacterized protein (TIGR02117 family)
MIIFKKVFQFFLSIMLIVLLYVAAAYLFALVTTDGETVQGEERVYLYSNDAFLSHTEIIFQVAPHQKELFDTFHSLLKNNANGYLSFSYGDRDFMMDEGGFDDLNITLALRSLFINTPALIKVGHYGSFSRKSVIELSLSKRVTKKLLHRILKSFKRKKGELIPYHDRYGRYYIHYYEAKKPYNLFYTCNSWSGEMLRESGIKMGLWTPFASNVISQLR